MTTPDVSSYFADGVTCELCGYEIRTSVSGGSPQDADLAMGILLRSAAKYHLSNAHPGAWNRLVAEQAGLLPDNPEDFVLADCQIQGCDFSYGIHRREPDIQPRLQAILIGHYAAQHLEHWRRYVTTPQDWSAQ